MLDPTLRATLIERFRGQPGPTGDGREEHLYFATHDTYGEVVTITTTRPATVADLLESDRPVLAVVESGDTIRVTLPGDEYRAGGILGALRRRVNMSDEQRAQAGARMRAIHAQPTTEA